LPRPRYFCGGGHVPVAQIIEAKNIYRPAVLIPCLDRKANVGKASERCPRPQEGG